MSPAMLSDLFTTWLRAGGDRRAEAVPLSAALVEAGSAPEGRLLAGYGAEGPHTTELPPGPAPWDGRRAHVGPLLPAAAPGELWFDTVELSLMALLPGDPIEDFAPEARHRWLPHRNWFALRPVAGWQYAGFLSAATLHVSPGPEHLTLFDPSRLTPENETSPVIARAPVEMLAYIRWFGKRVVDRWDWVDAARLLGADATRTLWTPGAREWAGGVTDLHVFAAIEPDEVEEDDRDAFDAEEDNPPTPEARRFFYLSEISPRGAAFRSTVDPQTGLFAVPLQLPGIEIRDTARR